MTDQTHQLDRIVVTGAHGMLGRAVTAALLQRKPDAAVATFGHQQLDITAPHAVRAAIRSSDLVINCAGIVPGRPEISRDRMYVVNALGPRALASAAGRLVQVSTDCVFDGQTDRRAYTETARPCPADHYGSTKLAGEVCSGNHLTVRGSFIGMGERGLIHWLLSQPYQADVPGFTDWMWNGFYVADYAELLLTVALGERTGLLHFGVDDPISKYTLLSMVARRVRTDLWIVPTEGGKRHMVLGSCQVPMAPAGWVKMVSGLERDYRATLCLAR